MSDQRKDVQSRPTGRPTFFSTESTYNLPVETLSLIFQYSLIDISTGPSIYNAPLNISCVSRYWRGVALSTPSIWAHIYFDDYLDVLKYMTYGRRLEGMKDFWRLSLSRSGRSLLDLYVNIRTHGQQDSALLQDVQTLLKNMWWMHCHRLRSIFLDVPITLLPPQITQAGLTLDNFPKLRELDLQPQSQFRSALVRIDINGTTGLRCMKLCNENVIYSFKAASSFPNLTTVNVLSTVYTRKDYFTLLSGAPALEEFRAIIPQQHDYSNYTGCSGDMVLQHIRVFHLTKATADRYIVRTACTILHRLTLPSLQDLHLCCDRGLHLNDDEHFDEELHDVVVGLFQRSMPPLKDLYLRMKVRESSLIEALRDLPQIEALSLYISPQSDALVKAMTRHATAPDTVGGCSERGVVCPRLRKLTINDAGLSVDAVAQMLVSRTLNPSRLQGAPPPVTHSTSEEQVGRLVYDSEVLVLPLQRVVIIQCFGGLDMLELPCRPEIAKLRMEGLHLAVL